MKAANKSPSRRKTITLPRSAFDILDDLRKEKRRREPEIFYQNAVAAYTPEVQSETLELNEATPRASE
jgi:hypothetical protein